MQVARQTVQHRAVPIGPGERRPLRGRDRHQRHHRKFAHDDRQGRADRAGRAVSSASCPSYRRTAESADSRYGNGSYRTPPRVDTPGAASSNGRRAGPCTLRLSRKASSHAASRTAEVWNRRSRTMSPRVRAGPVPRSDSRRCARCRRRAVADSFRKADRPVRFSLLLAPYSTPAADSVRDPQTAAAGARLRLRPQVARAASR